MNFYRDVINNKRSEAFRLMNKAFGGKYITGRYSNECIKLVNEYIEDKIDKNRFQNNLLQLKKEYDRYEEGINYMYKKCNNLQMTRQIFLNNITNNYLNIIDKYAKDTSLSHTYLDVECKKIEKLHLRQKIISQMIMEMYLNYKEFKYLIY